MQSVIVRPRHRRDQVGSLPAFARRAGARESWSRERHVGETPVTAVMAALSLALGLGAHDVGASARMSLLVGTLAYVVIVLLAERVHLDDRL